VAYKVVRLAKTDRLLRVERAENALSIVLSDRTDVCLYSVALLYKLTLCKVLMYFYAPYQNL